jgi:hypothetical protein
MEPIARTIAGGRSALLSAETNFERAGYFVPMNANQWVSAVFKVEDNDDGTFTYYGATGDGIVGDAGRNGMDVYRVTLPAPPKPAGSTKGGGRGGGRP